MKNKIVYGWFADGLPFYIGIGSVKRSQSKKGRNKYCSRKRAKAERENSFEVRVLHENLSWKEACEIEISLISLYGRADNRTGILTNMTNGGEGPCGTKRSQETIEKIRKANTGKKYSKETIEKLREAKLGRPLTDSHKKKIGLSNIGRNVSQETRDKISESHRKLDRHLTKSQKDKIRQRQSKPIMTPEGRCCSIVNASRLLGMSESSVRRRCTDINIKEFYYL